MSRAALKSIQAASGGGPVADTGDEYWGNTVLLLDGEGTDGGQNNTFTDSSSNSYTITETGDVSQGSFSPYLNNWSAYFENADSNITFTPSFSLGSNDFCIEFWANFSEAPPANSGPIIKPFNLTVNTGDYLSFELNNAGNGFIFRVRKSSANDVLMSDTADYTKDGGWVHLAATRDGNTFRLFVDGVLKDTDTFTGSLSSFTNGWIGCWTQIANDFKGYISNLRITNGSVPSSRQTSSTTSGDEIFTPPTSNLDTVTDTVLLTCRSNRFIDLSSSPHTLSISASPIITTFSPTKDSEAIDITTNGGSGYLSSAQTYLRSPTDADFDIGGTGEWAYEGWIYVDADHSFANYTRAFGLGPYYNDSKSFGVFLYDNDNSGYITVYWDDASGLGRKLISSVLFQKGQWNHLMVCRSSAQGISLYYNGTRIANNSSYTSSIDTGNTYAFLGHTGFSTEGYIGYASDTRFINGSHPHDASSDTCTVPTAPLETTTNTKLLLNFEDSNIYDLTGTCNIDTIDNASVDTSIKKYGSGSIQFDGTGDYLDLTHAGDLLDFPGDFTIEFWLYTTTTATQYMFDSRTGSGQTNYAVYFSSNYFRIIGNGTGYNSGTLSNYTNTWIHVAFVRSGSTGQWYINGTASGSAHSVGTSTYSTQAGTLRIGKVFGSGTTNMLNGYMDDFRITNGIARYTSNFTPSSEALPKF